MESFPREIANLIRIGTVRQLTPEEQARIQQAVVEYEYRDAPPEVVSTLRKVLAGGIVSESMIIAHNVWVERHNSQIRIEATATAEYLSDVGGQIAFLSNRGGDGLWVMDGDGSHLKLVTRDQQMWAGPAWSPDMQWLLYLGVGQGWDVFVVDVSGERKRNLTNAIGGDFPGSWSPDGTLIVFSSTRAYYKGDEKSEFELYLMNTDSMKVKKLVGHSDIDPNGEIFEKARQNPRLLVGAQAWSPDGSQIVFCASWPGGGDIYIVGVDGTGLRNLTNNPEMCSCNPAWSPDGQYIAFSAYVDNKLKDDIFLIRPDGTGLRQLISSPGNDTDPTWSFDSRLIAFISDRDGNREVYVMSSDGSDQRNLTRDPSDDYGAAWSPQAAPP